MGKRELTAEEVKAREEKAKEVAAAEAKAKEVNDARTGKGTRLSVSMTRGRNPQVISYEEFDESLPDTLPKTLTEFMDITKIQDEPKILGFLIDGYNQDSYTQASDPIAEFVEATWPDDVQKQFRMVVRQYSAGAGVSIEDAVSLIKPGIVKVHGPK